MTSDWLTAIAHVVLLSCFIVRPVRARRPEWSIAIATAAVVGFSWWWLTYYNPSEAPDWIVVIMVLGYVAATVFGAHLARRFVAGAVPHLGLTIVVGVLSLVPSALLAFLVWGIVTGL
jgi:4-amino-4-deoxy-L-arabinose transferase-like glycosyltransferase